MAGRGSAQVGGHRSHSRPVIQADSGALLAVMTGAGLQLGDWLVRIRACGADAKRDDHGGGQAMLRVSSGRWKPGISMLDSFHCHLLGHSQPGE